MLPRRLAHSCSWHFQLSGPPFFLHSYDDRLRKVAPPRLLAATGQIQEFGVGLLLQAFPLTPLHYKVFQKIKRDAAVVQTACTGRGGA